MPNARAAACCLVAALVCLCAAASSPAQTLVLVADGAGDFRCCSSMVRRAAASAGAPLAIETFVWSHGHRRSIADQVDAGHARAQGRRLAAEIAARRMAQPAERICLVGHSAGAAVVLAAAAHLPPDSLGCLVLLAPSLPADYDLTAALRSAQGGIHVFCSRADCWMTRAVRCLEVFKCGRLRAPAGRSGFLPPSGICSDCAYSRLRNYPWTPSLACLGHDGGHFGGYQPAFVQALILPLLQGEESVNSIQSRDR